MSKNNDEYEMVRQFDGESPSTHTSAHETDDAANTSMLPSTLTLPLPTEIHHSGKEYHTLELREPTLWEVTQASREIGSDINPSSLSEAALTLVRLVANIPAAVLDKINFDIINKAGDFVMSFEDRAREEAEERSSMWGEAIPQSYTLSFDPPLTGAGKTLDVMELGPPTVQAVRRARQLLRKNTIENINRSEALLLELVSGWPKAAILKMPISQKVQASEYLNSFLRSGR